MPLPTSINDLSTTAGSNSPGGTEDLGTTDNYLRVYASYIASLRDVVLSGTASLTTLNLAYTGTLIGSTGVLNIGAGQIYKDGSGNVGIGTATPAQKLDVAGNVRAILGFQNVQVGITTNIQSDASGAYIEVLGLNNLRFFNNSLERGRFDSAGNFGVGTTAPASLIHARGGAATEVRVESTTSTDGKFRAKNALGEYTIGLSGAANGHYAIYDVTNSQTIHEYTQGASGAHAFYTAGAERLRIDSIGNVGINNSAPVVKLDVGVPGDAAATMTRFSSGGFTTTIGHTASAAVFTNNSAARDIAFAPNSTERMRVKVTGQINLTGLAAAPTGAAGDIYYDSVTNKHYGHNGTLWNALY